LIERSGSGRWPGGRRAFQRGDWGRAGFFLIFPGLWGIRQAVIK
jgi:hypothetical protein